MRVIPAVDIKDGKCVRLVEGDRSRETVFFADPVDAARLWAESGAPLIHVVDLDGALSGQPRTIPILERIIGLGVGVEFGGGVRNVDTIETLVARGVARVVIGTAACEDPLFLEQAVSRFGSHVVLGLDLREGRVAVGGWTESREVAPIEMAHRAERVGIQRVIFTNVARDGTMSGPDLTFAERLASSVTIPVTLSGGISSLDDIRSVKRLSHLGIDEIIVGRALYDGAFSYRDAAQIAAS